MGGGSQTQAAVSILETLDFPIIKFTDSVTRISFIFGGYNFNSLASKLSSQPQSDYENAPETADIQDGSGRLVGASPYPCGGRAALECGQGR